MDVFNWTEVVWTVVGLIGGESAKADEGSTKVVIAVMTLALRIMTRFDPLTPLAYAPRSGSDSLRAHISPANAGSGLLS